MMVIKWVWDGDGEGMGVIGPATGQDFRLQDRLVEQECPNQEEGRRATIVPSMLYAPANRDCQQQYKQPLT